MRRRRPSLHGAQTVGRRSATLDLMGEMSRKGWLGVAVLLVPACVALIARATRATGSVAVGAVILASTLGALLLVIMVGRRRTKEQLAKMESGGPFEIDAGLDFGCLPGEWPVKARETLNSAGASSTPFLPVRLSLVDGKLLVDKKRSWGSGRLPFRAELPLADIARVEIGEADLAPAGSTLVAHDRSGRPFRAYLSMGAADAERVAVQLRRQLQTDGRAGATRSDGLVVTTADPPVRTSPQRAGFLLLVAFIPFAVAMAGAEEGPVAVVGSLLLLFYGLWLVLRRPPTMHRRLAVALAVTSVTFIVDTGSTAELWRLVGAVLCLGLAASLAQLRTPAWQSQDG